MVDVDRKRNQGDTAEHRVKFCLDELEKRAFSKDIDWDTRVTKRLTMEEMIGALVSAEQMILDVKRFGR